MCAASATMDIDDLMKETFSAILVDAKLERSVVIQVHKHEYALENFRTDFHRRYLVGARQ